MSFEKLLAELATAGESQETLRKALPTDSKDDTTILAAAGEAGAGQGEAAAGDAAGEGAAKEGADDKDDGEPVAKSLQVTMPDGTVQDAVDGTEMVKALHDRLDANESHVMKALEAAIGLIKGQGEMIKSLSETVKGQSQMIKSIGGEGRGRKSTVVLPGAADETVAKANAGMTGDELMAKAEAGQKAGKLMALDISMLETYLTRRQTPPENLVAKILAAGK